MGFFIFRKNKSSPINKKLNAKGLNKKVRD
jgi:hypothetical protein